MSVIILWKIKIVNMLYVLVVLHERELLASETILSLLKNIDDGRFKGELSLIIWDNSHELMSPNGSLTFLRHYVDNVIHRHTPQNFPLSTIYNIVIEEYLDKEDFLLLLDHDSSLSSGFISSMMDAIANNPSINLFIPKVWCRNVLISPALDFIIRTKYIKRHITGVVRSSHLTAINSGMVISSRHLKKFRYDERLTFYGTDNFFMKKYRKFNDTLFVVNTRIDHDLSFFSTEDIERKLNIFLDIKKSNLIVNSDNFVCYVLAFINNIISSIKMSIAYKDSRFFKNRV